MIYTYSELVEKAGSRRKVSNFIIKNNINKIGHGIYSNNERYNDDFLIYFKKYKHITLTDDCAFDYYNLTDYVPQEYTFATPSKARKINDKKVKQTYMKDEIFNVGRRKIKTSSGIIYIYDRERMLIELMRNKSKYPYDYYKELVAAYRELANANELNMWKVSEYAKKFSNGENIMHRIQEVIL